MSTFELCLPAMSMGVDEPRADNLIGAVEYFNSFGCRNVLRDPYDPTMLDQNVGLSGDDVILRVVDEGDTIFQEDTAGCHIDSCKCCDCLV
jgi:hypothetical protein